MPYHRAGICLVLKGSVGLFSKVAAPCPLPPTCVKALVTPHPYQHSVLSVFLVLAILACALTGDQLHNPGMCPDQELNWQLLMGHHSDKSSHTGQGSNFSSMTIAFHILLKLAYSQVTKIFFYNFP